MKNALRRIAGCALALGLSIVATSCGPSSAADAGADAGFVQPVLAPPPPGRGIQLRVSFSVPAGTEQQRCWSFRLPTETDLEVVRYEVAYNVGSHHMNLFRMLPTMEATRPHVPETGMGGEGEPCFNAVDFDTYDLVVGSQEGRLDWQLPQGVAYRLHARSWMLLQSHFVNGRTQITPGDRAEVLVNLWTAENPAQITQHMGTMFANNRQLNIPPRSRGVEFSRSCDLPRGGTIAAMTGHFHSRGRSFTVFESPNGSDPGRQCYESASWAEPPFTTFTGTEMINVPAGGGLYYRCTFDNPTDFPITFGPHVEYEEHCNLFAYYFPVDPDARARYCF